jgi:hypothetical protein
MFFTEEVEKCPLCGHVGRLVDVATGKTFWQSPERREEGIAAQAEAPAPVPRAPYPVSLVCPQCGHTEFRATRPDSWVAFVWDRVCKNCNTRYTPPTPLWAGVVFIVAGLLLAGWGALSIFMGLLTGDPLGMVCWGTLGVLGLLAIIHGIRSLANPGKA